MIRKTSLTDPLQIQSVEVDKTSGVIGMTICPGRKGNSMAGGSWDRDLALDLEVVRCWQPDIVIALLEEHEYSALGIPTFCGDVADAALPWVFLPIVDGGIPNAAFVEAWRTVGPHIRNILRRGGRVLVHCRAGLGRTGLLAAMLLVELGENADSAISRVRAARPHTIETRAQEAYVRATVSLPAKPSREAGITGAMWGAAIGDALGSAFEFVDARSIAAELGEPFCWTYRSAMQGSLLYPREPGIPTDDTAMALSVAHVIAAGPPYRAETFAKAFSTDLEVWSGRFAKMFWTGGPGSATMRALRKLQQGAAPDGCGDVEDGGNGSAMRAHPVGFLKSRQSVLDVAATQAKVTHGHPASVAAAQAVALTIFDALAGCEPDIAPPGEIDECDFTEAWARAHNAIGRSMDRLPDHLLNVDMSGWETVAAAHAIAYIYQDDPHRAIAAAAASGRDTDTLASIVGAIVGARSGATWIAPALIESLNSRNLLCDAIDRLTNFK